MILEIYFSLMMWHIRISWRLVCICQNGTPGGKAVFLFVYDTEQGEIGEYNFIENPEKFMLKMKSGVFNAGIGEQEYNAYKNLFLL